METLVINSEQIMLPPAVLSKLKGKRIHFVEVQDGFMMKPVSQVPAAKTDLEKLLDGISEDNIHSEIDTGKPEGKEIW